MAELPALSPEVARELVPGWLATHVVEEARDDVVREVGAVLEQATPDELSAMVAAINSSGDGYKLHSADPLARRISHAFIPTLVTSDEVRGLEGLAEACAAGPTLWLSNHWSYVDTQATDYLLVKHGLPELAESVIAVAGPKVYGTTFRKLAVTCLNSLKTAQSSRLAHNDAELSPREVARIAVNTLQAAKAFALDGHPILVYAEGSRSRTGALCPFLRGVSKYGRAKGTRMIPVAISGTETVFPIDAPLMARSHVQLTFGEPVVVEGIGPVAALEETWRRIRAALPEHQRPGPEVAPIA